MIKSKNRKMKINTSTLKFLSDLKKNNNRDWFNDNKNVFQTEQGYAKDFYNAIIGNLKKHDEIDKFKLFRIYRDVRFSKDKTPYNPHFAGSFSRMGKKLRGGYYLRIRPGESFLAGGFWAPNKEDIFRIRKEFEYDDSQIRSILSAKPYKDIFGGILVGDELKTAPKGFDREHPAIDLIRKKAFISVLKFTDEEVLSPDFLMVVDSSYRALRPYFDYMSEVLTTNLNGEPLFD